MTAVGSDGSTAFSRPLKGSEKVAVLLLALNESQASQLLQQFDPDEIARIRRAADNLEPITAQDLDAIVEDFAAQVSTGLSFIGTPDEMHTLLNAALQPDQAEAQEDVAEEVSPETADVDVVEEPPVWAQLADAPEEILVPFLESEHPQTVTAILTQVDGELSAKMVAQIPEELRLDVMRRMLTVKPAHEDAVKALEDGLRAGLMADQADASGNEAHKRIANIINRMDGEQRQQLIDSISETAPEEAEQIKRLLFSFEDIVKLSETARQILFGQVATDTLVTALHGADETLRELALSALSARSRRMVESELASGSDPGAQDSGAAKRTIATIALGLAERGEIQIEEEDEEG